MSDFPKENYSTKLSNVFISKLKSYGLDSEISLIIRKEKNQYLYDIDMNKYTDFFLNNGSVIVGHNNKVLTKYIKNAISIGTENVFLNKFYYKLVRLFSSITSIKNIGFYTSIFFAFYEILKNNSFKSIGVNSSYLFNLLKVYFPDLNIVYPIKRKVVDLFIFEPLEFDNNLEITDFKNVKAKKYCSYEGRTFFRINQGFFYSIDVVDYVLAGNIIANGMDTAVLISKESLKTQIIPSYLSVAILETIKYYIRKKIEFPTFNYDFVKSQKGGILKLNHQIELKEFLKKGVFLIGDVAFLSIFHTEHDLKRLEKAINKN
ncbi:MAG: hypothetical protein ACP5Q5_09825 [Brevinematia bacterium]